MDESLQARIDASFRLPVVSDVHPGQPPVVDEASAQKGLGQLAAAAGRGHHRDFPGGMPEQQVAQNPFQGMKGRPWQ